MINSNFSRVMFGFILLTTLCSVGYFCLIFFDIAGVIFKKWGHGNFLFLKISTISFVFFLIIGNILVATLLKIAPKKIVLYINATLLIVWLLLISLGAVGIIW